MPTRKNSHDSLRSLAPIDENHDNDGSTELKMPSSLQQKLSQSSASSSSAHSNESTRLQQIQIELYDFHSALYSKPSSFLAEMNSLVRESFPTFYEFVAILQQLPAFDKKAFLGEIERTKTTLYTPRGVTISDQKQVARYLTVENAGRRKPHELIYKAATSKIFDQTAIIESLTTSGGLIRPELNAKATIKDCAFEISLKDGKPHLVAECFLHVTIPCGRRSGKSASRWTIVCVMVEVYFRPFDETLSVELLHLSPAEQLSERQLRSVARECLRR